MATTKATTSDRPVQATVRLPEALWRRVRIKAIENGSTASDYVRKALEASLGPGRA